jgi:hypothetical protein
MTLTLVASLERRENVDERQSTCIAMSHNFHKTVMYTRRARER